MKNNSEEEVHVMINYNKFTKKIIPGTVENNRRTNTWEILSDDNYRNMLNMKLLKEVNDYLETDSYEELADITEFIMAILEFKNFHIHEIDDINFKNYNILGMAQ